MQEQRTMVMLILAVGFGLFGAAVPVWADDADGDGIDDAVDVCDNTPTGVEVDAEGRPLGDVDRDCDTDLSDYGLFQRGFTGVLGEDHSCDPVAQTGCGFGEKCTFVPDPGNPSDMRTVCRPDGSVLLGRACTIDENTGVDNCVAGLFCEGGVCAEICSVTPDSCPYGKRCWGLPGLVDSPGLGTCDALCDPLAIPSDCPEGEACFLMLFEQGASVCATPYGTGTQGVACEYINGCASGYSCVLIDPPVNPTGLVCAFICDASEGGGPTCTQGPGPSYICPQINQVYPDLPGLPDAWGMCLDPVDWDEDGDGVLDFEDQCPGTPPGTPVGPDGCP